MSKFKQAISTAMSDRATTYITEFKGYNREAERYIEQLRLKCSAIGVDWKQLICTEGNWGRVVEVVRGRMLDKFNTEANSILKEYGTDLRIELLADEKDTMFQIIWEKENKVEKVGNGGSKDSDGARLKLMANGSEYMFHMKKNYIITFLTSDCLSICASVPKHTMQLVCEAILVYLASDELLNDDEILERNKKLYIVAHGIKDKVLRDDMIGVRLTEDNRVMYYPKDKFGNRIKGANGAYIEYEDIDKNDTEAIMRLARRKVR